MNLSLAKKKTTNLGHTGEITAAIAGGSLLLLGIVSLVLYRNWKYEQELDSLLWKVDYKEIQLHENEKENNCQKQTRVSITIHHKKKIIKTTNQNKKKFFSSFLFFPFSKTFLCIFSLFLLFLAHNYNKPTPKRWQQQQQPPQTSIARVITLRIVCFYSKKR